MKKANVLILAGQSNAVGVGYTKYLTRHFDSETVAKFYSGYENVWINYISHGIKSNGFVKTTVNCTEAAKDTLGPEVGIAKYLSEKYPEEQFFIIKCAFGGATMFNDWLSPSNGSGYYEEAGADEYPDIVEALNAGKHPKGGWCYNEFTKLLKQSLSELISADYEVQVRGFFWMQGESDSYDMELVNGYIKRYDNLLKDFKFCFMPFLTNCVYVDAGISKHWLYYKELNARKEAYAKEHGYVYIDTIGAELTTSYEPEEQPDLAHYDSGCVVKLGELFAESIDAVS